jgi:hypothetical protein
MYFCWACDYSKITGEGQLARHFVRDKFNNNAYIYSPNKFFNQNFLLKIFNYKYFTPFIGIFICWFIYFKKDKPVYLNYLPLWNFILFLTLPPKTILGPITGGAKFNNKNYIRRFLFPIFYKISILIIATRFKKTTFSTDLLKKYLNKNFITKNNFNYVLKLLNKKFIYTKKTYDFIIYYRLHKNKIDNFPYQFIKRLVMQKFKVCVVGDKLNIFGVTNYGYLENEFIKQIINKSKYTLSSNENLFSIFTLECINKNLKIVVNSKNKKTLNIMKKIKNNFIFVDLNKNNFNKSLFLKKTF